MTNKIPDVLEIAKEVMPSVLNMVTKRVRNTIYSLLGFHEGSWNEIELKKDSILLQEILESEEYQELKSSVKEELLSHMKTAKFSVKNKSDMVRSIRERVYSNIYDSLAVELSDLFSKQVMEILSNEPSIQPALVAAKIIEASSKQRTK